MLHKEHSTGETFIVKVVWELDRKVSINYGYIRNNIIFNTRL